MTNGLFVEGDDGSEASSPDDGSGAFTSNVYFGLQFNSLFACD
jgi:hypothetical protein